MRTMKGIEFLHSLLCPNRFLWYNKGDPNFAEDPFLDLAPSFPPCAKDRAFLSSRGCHGEDAT